MDDLHTTSLQRAERLLAVDGRTPGGMLLAPLIPLSHLYGLAMRTRAALYARGLLRQQILPCRVISVGNLTVGGTGKTPVVIALASAGAAPRAALSHGACLGGARHARFAGPAVRRAQGHGPRGGAVGADLDHGFRAERGRAGRKRGRSGAVRTEG